MTRIERQVVIAKPAAEVFSYAGDWRNFTTYLDYIQEVKPLTETTRGKGAKYLVDLTYLGRKMTSEWETIEYDHDKGWTFTAPLMGIVARKYWSFEPMGEVTRVSFALEYDPKPPIIAPLADALLLRRKWDQIYERGLQNLKRTIEGGSAEQGLRRGSSLYGSAMTGQQERANQQTEDHQTTEGQQQAADYEQAEKREAEEEQQTEDE